MMIMGLMFSANAFAQNIGVEDGSIRVQQCYVVTDGVQCDFLFTATKNGSKIFGVSDFDVVSPDGRSTKGTLAGLGGPGSASGYSVNLNYYAGTPIKFSIFFVMTEKPTRLAVVGVFGKPINNVPVAAKYGAAPVAAAPAPAPATVVLKSGPYNAVLSNCKAGANGTATCIATLTPSK
ncbi:hypothetical protein GCM10008937_34630 [Deinococcus depolymerans]|uniref:Uncharacterized protein n=2 Tax=Deinococcus depolymerans TaxID=392408 RepID=A0ABN1CRF0_9DEIO